MRYNSIVFAATLYASVCVFHCLLKMKTRSWNLDIVRLAARVLLETQVAKTLLKNCSIFTFLLTLTPEGNSVFARRCSDGIKENFILLSLMI